MDIDAARETAYAEKPARDYIAVYKENLSAEARQSLEWIASQEGEKALQRYEETKNEEDPIVRVLRERALESIKFPKEISSTVREGHAVVGSIQGEEWVAGCEWALSAFGGEMIKTTLADEHLTLSQKKSSL